MIQLLKNRGFTNSESNTWIRRNWTVRFDDELIEIFNNPNLERGYYYCGPINNEDLETALNEIENFEFNNID